MFRPSVIKHQKNVESSYNIYLIYQALTKKYLRGHLTTKSLEDTRTAIGGFRHSAYIFSTLKLCQKHNFYLQKL
jgi:hypothetical protein